MFKRSVTFSRWAVLFAAVGGLFLSTALLLQRDSLFSFFQKNSSTQSGVAIASSEPPKADLGPRHQLTYERWVTLLAQESRVAAEKRPSHLTVLAGDSISLWFPQDLLPVGFTWLNQGISGETSYGLLRRLKLFDATEPETIFVMIGINDLIRGVSELTLLANQQEIIRHLKTAHPRSRIVVQSILPHAVDRLLRQNRRPLPVWTERLASVPNRRIRELNQELAAIAKAERVDYLELHPYFLDPEDNLSAELTTDGLHLSHSGYQVWRSHLEAISQTHRSGSESPP